MKTRSSTQVAIVGAGPTGLTLACELARAGVQVRVLEGRIFRTRESRAVGLYARTMESLELWGRSARFAERGRQVPRIQLGFGGAVEFGELDSAFRYFTMIPQSATEELLEDHARELGVQVIRECMVTGLEQDQDEVTLHLRGQGQEWTERAGYVVGCDGSGSVVRAELGLAFEGSTYPFGAILGDVRLRRPPAAEMLLLPGPGSAMVAMAYGDGWYRLACMDRKVTAGGHEPATLAELRAILKRISGEDLEPYAPRWLSWFKLHQRLARRYRVGRVLLAGDAAHLHSPIGGQGINLGVQDAMNLGWKLAAVVHGWAPPWLLDSYEAERRPVARAVIKNTDRATLLMTAPSPVARAVRNTAASQLLKLAPVRRRLASTMSGLTVRYPAAPGAGPLCGQWAPNLALVLPGGVRTGLRDLTRDGRFLLLDLTREGTAAMAASQWFGQVHSVRAEVDGVRPERVTALLVRPDGYVAWSTSEATTSTVALETGRALAHWCGSPPVTAEAEVLSQPTTKGPL